MMPNNKAKTAWMVILHVWNFQRIGEEEYAKIVLLKKTIDLTY
jgi:hypothetical protein